MGEEGRALGKRARDLNNEIRYTMWSVFRARTDADRLAPGGRDPVIDEVQTLLDQYAAKGVVTRGSYDVAGFRADADFLFWWHAPSSDDLQAVYAEFRRTALGQASEPVWSAMA